MDEHYIDFTALVGPIGEPHKLHTFDADGNVNRTVHGDLAERLASAVWDVDHDADISTHITTEAEMQARADAVEEQDRLRAVVTKLEAERDRLRAVVEAARMVLTVIDSTLVGQMVDGIEGHDEITLLRVRLDQLDGSAGATRDG